MSTWLQPSWGAGARWYAELVRRGEQQGWSEADVRALQAKVRRLTKAAKP